MKKALIVGYSGQDGTLLSLHLKNQGYSVLGLSSNSRILPNGVIYEPIDILCRESVRSLINDFQPDEIYYLAAFHHSSQETTIYTNSFYQKSHDLHVTGLLNFLEGILTAAPKSRIFYASSALIFGATTCAIQNESTPIRPDSIYAITKAAGMGCCRYFKQNFGVRASTGILFNHESPLRSEKFVSRKISKAAALAKLGQLEAPIQVGSLEARADWGSAKDYVEAFHEIVLQSEGDDFVVATGETHSVRDLIESAFKSVDLPWRDWIEESPGVIHRPSIPRCGDSSKLKLLTGWKPKTEFSTMISEMVRQDLENLGPNLNMKTKESM